MSKFDSIAAERAYAVVLDGFSDSTWDFGDDTGYVDIYDQVGQIIIHNDDFGFVSVTSKTASELDEELEEFNLNIIVDALNEIQNIYDS